MCTMLEKDRQQSRLRLAITVVLTVFIEKKEKNLTIKTKYRCYDISNTHHIVNRGILDAERL